MLSEEIKKFRLGIYAHNPSDGRSLSRLLGPFNEMARQDRRLEVVTPRRTPDNAGWDLDWQFFTGLDAAYFLDPYTHEDLSRVGLARACGCKVWVDYIDDLFNVRPSNVVWAHYADRAGVVRNIAEIVRRANVATCTNETLRGRFPEPDGLMVLPESCRWPVCPHPRKRVVSWRGASGHIEDVESVLEDLHEVSRLPQFSKWEWVFFGEPPWKIQHAIPSEQLTIVPFQTPYKWMEAWGSFAPYLHIVPMADNPFNRCKSPLSWLEATAIGAAVIGPDLPEWATCGGLIRYAARNGSPNGEHADRLEACPTFKEVLRREMESFNGQLHPKAIESRADVYPAKTVQAVNELRWAILNMLAGAGNLPVGTAASPQETAPPEEVEK